MANTYNPEHITYFAETDYRNQKTKFGIKSRDRTRHMYVIGKSGVGKSTLLENMAIQDIQNGDGLAVLDPHGSFAEKMLDYIPSERIKDVIYFAPFDIDHPISFNVLEDVGPDKRHFVASGLMSTFKKIWVDAWSARMEYILNNILLALLEYPNATLLGVNRMLSDKKFRDKVVANCTDPGVKSFWTDEFAKYGERYMQEAGASIQNKIGQLTANPLIRNIIGQPKSSFDIREIMDNQKILIINLSKGRIGEQNTSLLGSMIITKIYLAAMGRADVTPERLKLLPNFYFYVDEFQSFANESFANILSEARKYKLALIIAHQYIAQMEESVRDAVFGNVGTSISFRVGPLDAELLEKVFSPQFDANDLINLGMAQIYLSLMINDMGSAPFSARTLPPMPFPEITFRDDVIEWSRTKYASPKNDVEESIQSWYNEGIDENKQNNYSSEKKINNQNTNSNKPVLNKKQDVFLSKTKIDKTPKQINQKISDQNKKENDPLKDFLETEFFNKKDIDTKIDKVEEKKVETNSIKENISSIKSDLQQQVNKILEEDNLNKQGNKENILFNVSSNANTDEFKKPTDFARVRTLTRFVPRSIRPTLPPRKPMIRVLERSLKKDSNSVEDYPKSERINFIPNDNSLNINNKVFDDDKRVKENIKPIKLEERGATEKNKELLRAALAELENKETKEIKEDINKISKDSINSVNNFKNTDPNIVDLYQSGSTKEVDTSTLKKVLE